MTAITDEELAHWQALEQAASAAPWAVFVSDDPELDDVRVCCLAGTAEHEECDHCIAVALAGETEQVAIDGVMVRQWTAETRRRWEADAKFIAESRQAMPRLLREVHGLRAALKVLRATAEAKHASE